MPERTVDAVPLSWQVRERPGLTVVEFTGEIDEHAEFAALAGRLRGAVVFQLAEVRRINSCGVREWVNFVRDLRDVTDLTFTHCSPAIVTQLNMIFNFRGAAKVRSFFAPYICDGCGFEEDKLLDVQAQFAAGPAEPPSFPCEQCGGEMAFDELPERYLSFLAER
jgi:anti-anti-sigma regulatory factor